MVLAGSHAHHLHTAWALSLPGQRGMAGRTLPAAQRPGCSLLAFRAGSLAPATPRSQDSEWADIPGEILCTNTRKSTEELKRTSTLTSYDIRCAEPGNRPRLARELPAASPCQLPFHLAPPQLSHSLDPASTGPGVGAPRLVPHGTLSFPAPPSHPPCHTPDPPLTAAPGPCRI